MVTTGKQPSPLEVAIEAGSPRPVHEETGSQNGDGEPADDEYSVKERREIVIVLYPSGELNARLRQSEEEFNGDLVQNEDFHAMLESQIVRMRMLKNRHERQLRDQQAKLEQEAKARDQAAESLLRKAADEREEGRRAEEAAQVVQRKLDNLNKKPQPKLS